MWPASLDLTVSHETAEKLKIYHGLLLKWQKAINLVSPKTLDESWIRHFADSVQVERYVSRESSLDGVGQPREIADIGSGAGFPGMVLAILRPDLEISLVESDERKCQFLRTVSRETNVRVSIFDSRIEEVAEELNPDFVTARALADVTKLIGYVEAWGVKNPNLECVFLKGARVDEELKDAQQLYSFDAQTYPSVTDPQGCILHLRNIRKL